MDISLMNVTAILPSESGNMPVYGTEIGRYDYRGVKTLAIHKA